MSGRGRLLAGLLAIGALVPACQEEPDGANLVHRAIEVHGGSVFENARTTFTFRGEDWLVERRNGLFRYERAYRDPEDRAVVEGLTNDSTYRRVEGQAVELDGEDREEVELAVNSVVYFAFLPFRLDEPAAQVRFLESRRIRGEPYDAVEVTFREEGGGPDWEDRFVHWFHREEGTLDYVAYRYHRNGGGTRFREAVNRRQVGGLLVQDYVNSHVEGIEDIADYPDSLEVGALEHVSDVELEDVEVRPES